MSGDSTGSMLSDDERSERSPLLPASRAGSVGGVEDVPAEDVKLTPPAVYSVAAPNVNGANLAHGSPSPAVATPATVPAAAAGLGLALPAAQLPVAALATAGSAAAPATNGAAHQAEQVEAAVTTAGTDAASAAVVAEKQPVSAHDGEEALHTGQLKAAASVTAESPRRAQPVD